MKNPTECCIDNKLSKNDRSNVIVLENVEEKNSGDETEVRVGTSNNESEQGHTGKFDEYDPFLDIPIALRKDLVKEVYMSPRLDLKPNLVNRVAKSKEGIFVSQRKYTLDLLTETACLQTPYEEHMEVVDRILRYLKMTPGKGLMFRKTDRKTIEAYIDSNYIRSVVNRKATFDYCIFVWNNLITWRSKK
ncbi:putative mitochondrial protein [Cucumis melo var. makuwa]|uniref:Mitochondrial protein n=1 Tax=Cucumis melo var. makuwa TaxID=1194695 RepID=A0A5A7U356_CUCMM|nr:putative mitochondrial protein [Cucumis melo var. makuwa]